MNTPGEGVWFALAAVSWIWNLSGLPLVTDSFTDFIILINRTGAEEVLWNGFRNSSLFSYNLCGSVGFIEPWSPALTETVYCKAVGVTIKSDTVVLSQKKVDCPLECELQHHGEEFNYLGVFFICQERVEQEIDRCIGAGSVPGFCGCRES